MTVNSGLSSEAPKPTNPSGDYTSSTLKKGSNVFRPGAVKFPAILPGGGMVNAPYGPMLGTGTAQGAFFPALYNGTDQEVFNILAGVDEETGTGQPLSPAFRKSLKQILVQGGYLSKSDYVPSASFGYADISAMKDLLRDANYRGGLTWKDTIAKVMDELEVKGAGGGPQTTTYTQYQISNPEEAEMIVDASLQSLIGRNATRQEKSVIAAALKKYEQANPTRTTTTRSGTSTVSTTTGGVTAEGRQEASLSAIPEATRQEAKGVINTQVGSLIIDMLRNV